jgi:hypothetical protein
MPTSINVFAVNHVSPTVLGIRIDPQSFQVLNPFWIIMVSPVLAWLYAYLNRRDNLVGGLCDGFVGAQFNPVDGSVIWPLLVRKKRDLRKLLTYLSTGFTNAESDIFLFIHKNQ